MKPLAITLVMLTLVSALVNVVYQHAHIRTVHADPGCDATSLNGAYGLR